MNLPGGKSYREVVSRVRQLGGGTSCLGGYR